MLISSHLGDLRVPRGLCLLTYTIGAIVLHPSPISQPRAGFGDSPIAVLRSIAADLIDVTRTPRLLANVFQQGLG
jgi:hypothetical protein